MSKRSGVFGLDAADWKAVGGAFTAVTVWAVIFALVWAIAEASTGYDLKAAHPWLCAFLFGGPCAVCVWVRVLRAAKEPT